MKVPPEEARGQTSAASERTLRARLAAHVLHSRYDSRELTAAARAAFNDRWEREVDPDGVLDRKERAKRARHAKSAHFSRLALRSAKVRRSRSHG